MLHYNTVTPLLKAILDAIDAYLHSHFNYVDTNDFGIIGMGKSYFVGNSADESIKLDLYYTDAFIDEPLVVENIRLATIEEIIAMKLDDTLIHTTEHY